MKCENCGEEIKDGIFGKNKILSKNEIDLINLELNLKKNTYCKKCGNELLMEATSLHYKREDEKRIIKNELKKNIKHIPILTTHSPYKWEYTSLGLVSGQLVGGTGFVSEFFADFTDLFGAKSDSFTNKITKNEKIVLNILRAKTLQLGGNAVIATDIDYAEVGGSRGMLMVCAAGTAVKLHNLDVLDNKSKIILEKIETWNNLLSLEGKVFQEEYNKYKL